MKRGIWISLFVLFVYLLSYAGIQHSIDELATLSLSESIIHRSFAVNRMEWEQSRYPPQNAYGVDGNLYSKKGLGMAFAILPFLLIGKYWSAVGAGQFSFLTSAFVTTATIFVFYHTARWLKFNKNVSTLSALALGLGTLLWPYSQMLFSESAAALGVSISLLGLVALWKNLDQKWLLLCGVGGGVIILSRSANVIIFIPVAAALVYRLWMDLIRRKRWLRTVRLGMIFGAPVAFAVTVTVLNNYLHFGTFFTFPTVEGEAFTTPLAVGISGQLWSSGKGLLFYVPLSLLALLSFGADFRKMRHPLYLTALMVIVVPLLFYGKWYDWPGGKAWGPRFLVPTMPALVMLCLPAINWLSLPSPKWRRPLLGAWLILTFMMQLPGVLVNFEYQETLDGKAGATYQDLLWNWTYSPLLTYWNKIFTGTANLVWFHPYFWKNSLWLLVLIGLVILIIAALHTGLLLTSRAKLTRKGSNTLLGMLGVLTVVLGIALVVAARDDPRWWERTEKIETNRQVRAFVDAQGRESDVIMLELKDRYDGSGRIREWLNEAPLQPDYIGFKRKPDLVAIDSRRLRNWLASYSRVWLVMQATPYAAVESTTENWLRQWAYEGQNHWIEEQRIVEFLLPRSDEFIMLEDSAVFQTSPLLSVDYQVKEGKLSSYVLIELIWDKKLPGLNYAVHELNPDQTILLQQIDRPISDGEVQKLGFHLSGQDSVLMLRVYDPITQEIFPVITEAGMPSTGVLLYPGSG